MLDTHLCNVRSDCVFKGRDYDSKYNTQNFRYTIFVPGAWCKGPRAQKHVYENLR